jgi:hypothetical protein
MRVFRHRSRGNPTRVSVGHDYKGVTGETTFDAKGDLRHGVISQM